LLLASVPFSVILLLSLFNPLLLGEGFEETDADAELLYSTTAFVEIVPMVFDYLMVTVVEIVFTGPEEYLTIFTWNVLRFSSKIIDNPFE
jgi:hypothetical protein